MKVLMDKKQAAVVALLSAVLGAAALFFGAGAASAAASGPSTWCTNGEGDTEQNVPNPYVTASVEHWNDWNDWEIYTVCWSTTPPGSSDPEAAGGNFQVSQHDDGTVRVACHGDRNSTTVATVDCENFVTPTDPSSAPGTTASASVKVLTFGPVSIGQTGAEVDPATTTDAPLSGGTTTGGSAGLGAGTCTYVDGTPDCPFGFTIIAVSVNEADLIPVVTPHTPTPPCTGVNNTCAPVGGSVGFFQDTSNPTVTVETPTTSPTTVDVAPTGVCLHVSAPACP